MLYQLTLQTGPLSLLHPSQLSLPPSSRCLPSLRLVRPKPLPRHPAPAVCNPSERVSCACAPGTGDERVDMHGGGALFPRSDWCSNLSAVTFPCFHGLSQILSFSLGYVPPRGTCLKMELLWISLRSATAQFVLSISATNVPPQGGKDSQDSPPVKIQGGYLTQTDLAIGTGKSVLVSITVLHSRRSSASYILEL